MSNSKISIFEAEAISLFEMYRKHGGMVGFRIPIYQRQYDWEKDNVKRLFEDILNGLYSRKTDENSLAFLGAFIILDEARKESSFDGRSLSIIDGQQRITTLSLLSCVLYDSVKSYEKSLDDLSIPANLREWLEREIRYKKNKLRSLIVGEISEDGTTHFPFPRIVRELEDHRGLEQRDSEYKSAISKFLFDFNNDVIRQQAASGGMFFKNYHYSDDSAGKSIKQNIAAMQQFAKEVSIEIEDATALSIELPSASSLLRRSYRLLFSKLPPNQDEENKLFSLLKEHSSSVLGISRLLCFTSFMLDNLIVTAVTVADEKYGFDIFDALNTTGEPLTAVQTFKPQVVKFAQKVEKSYVGSQYEQCMNEIENYINEFSGTDSQQRAAKDLVVSFALYKTGEKLSLHLDQQRIYLRSNFIGFENDGGNERKGKFSFLDDLRKVAIYRRLFWNDETLTNKLPHHPERDLVLMCLKFLRDMKMSLVVPILCRYYFESETRQEPNLFSQAVKAITAFVVIRRGTTGSTRGIDTVLRKLMDPGRIAPNDPSIRLCVGLDSSHQFIQLRELKDHLRLLLQQKKFGVSSKNDWVSKAVDVELYSHSSPLCRFLLMLALHNSRQDQSDPTMLSKERESSQLNYLNYSRWVSEEFSTVEHIAPENGIVDEWDPDIYKRNLVHTVGNLSLLPRRENSVAGNKSWDKKKWLFKAFACDTEEEIRQIQNEASDTGYNFSQQAELLLKTSGQLPVIKTVAVVTTWDADHINRRSNNILSNAWYELSQWLDYSE